MGDAWIAWLPENPACWDTRALPLNAAMPNLDNPRPGDRPPGLGFRGRHFRGCSNTAPE